MGTHSQHQARRRTLRIPLWWIQLGLMVLSAAIVVGVGLFLLAALFSMADYIQSVIP